MLILLKKIENVVRVYLSRKGKSKIKPLKRHKVFVIKQLKVNFSYNLKFILQTATFSKQKSLRKPV